MNAQVLEAKLEAFVNAVRDTWNRRVSGDHSHDAELQYLWQDCLDAGAEPRSKGKLVAAAERVAAASVAPSEDYNDACLNLLNLKYCTCFWGLPAF